MLSGYCAGWSLRTLLHEGLNGVPGKVAAAPPKHLSSAIGQMVNFLGTLQNEWAGAQAFSSFDTYLAPFIRKDNLDYATVRQCIQEFVYNLNMPSRWGTQTPFTNITIDWVCPDDLREQIPIIAGEEMPFSYGELQAEMDMINQAYIEVMTAGDSKGRVFTFPIPTYNITRDFNWESDNALRLFEMTARYGLFGSAEQTGSLGGHFKQSQGVVGFPVKVPGDVVGGNREGEHPALAVTRRHHLNVGLVDHVHLGLQLAVTEWHFLTGNNGYLFPQVVRADPVDGDVGERSLGAPAGWHVQVVNKLLDALAHGGVVQVVLADKRGQVGVEGAEGLGAGPFVLQGAKKIDHLADGA